MFSTVARTLVFTRRHGHRTNSHDGIMSWWIYLSQNPCLAMPATLEKYELWQVLQRKHVHHFCTYCFSSFQNASFLNCFKIDYTAHLLMIWFPCYRSVIEHEKAAATLNSKTNRERSEQLNAKDIKDAKTCIHTSAEENENETKRKKSTQEDRIRQKQKQKEIRSRKGKEDLCLCTWLHLLGRQFVNPGSYSRSFFFCTYSKACIICFCPIDNSCLTVLQQTNLWSALYATQIHVEQSM